MWLLTGKTLYFFTVLLSGSSSFQPVQRFSEGGAFEGGPSLFGFSVVFCVQVAYNKLIS